MLNLVFIYVVLYRFKVYRELGIIRQCLVLWIVFVQIEIVVVGYVRIRLDGGNVAGRSQLPTIVEAVQLRVRESCRVGANTSGSRTQLMTQPLIQRSLALKTTLELGYPRVYRRHLGLSLRQG